MRKSILQQCMELLNRDDIKIEIRQLTRKIVDLTIIELYPYIYFLLAIVISSLSIQIWTAVKLTQI
jgi:hypothetical protein